MKSEEALQEQEDLALEAYFELLGLAKKNGEPIAVGFESQWVASVLLKAASHLEPKDDARELLTVRAIAVLSKPVATLLGLE
jgi:hypothetical protein